MSKMDKLTTRVCPKFLLRGKMTEVVKKCRIMSFPRTENVVSGRGGG